jgi:putative Holliday junction resolvase
MPSEVFLGFDFGFKRIGVAVGQRLTCSASPLPTVSAREGVPEWSFLDKLVKQWRPDALIVGLPKCIDGSKLYTTPAAKRFAKALELRYSLPVYLVDERLSTIEARAFLFEKGGYSKIRKTEVDGVAACIILDQWLQHPQ